MVWKPGQSGNRNGRGKGKPNKLTSRIRELIDGNAADILAKVIEQAKAGDSQAQAAFLKLLPKYRVVMTTVEMPVARAPARRRNRSRC